MHVVYDIFLLTVSYKNYQHFTGSHFRQQQGWRQLIFNQIPSSMWWPLSHKLILHYHSYFWGGLWKQILVSKKAADSAEILQQVLLWVKAFPQDKHYDKKLVEGWTGQEHFECVFIVNWLPVLAMSGLKLHFQTKKAEFAKKNSKHVLAHQV